MEFHLQMRHSILLITITWGLALLSCAPAESTADKQQLQARVVLPWVTPEVRAPRIQYGIFKSKAAGANVSYHVYKPLAYDRETRQHFPVLYWLHGTDGGVAGVRPLAKHFHIAIRDGHIPPMMVVFVNGLPRRLWSDSKDGTTPVETVFINELIPHIDHTFRTIPSREGRIIEGFSMGGYGAARLGLKYPELFAGVSILGGGPLDPAFQGPRAKRNPQDRKQILLDVCDGNMEYFKALSPWVIVEANAENLCEYKTVVRLAVGDRDKSLADNRRFHEHLTQFNVTHDFIVLPNVKHDPMALLAALGKKDRAFYKRALTVTSTVRHQEKAEQKNAPDK